jgi:ArsR family transcriptional regulator, nickel/cobalt-responsive transcriptional repressor
MEDALESSRCAQLLKAIADPERLRIVQCLRRGSRNVGEMADSLDLEIANVSHHLGVLRQSGFVIAVKQGRFVVYSLNPEIFVARSSGKMPNRIDLGCCRIEFP